VTPTDPLSASSTSPTPDPAPLEPKSDTLSATGADSEATPAASAAGRFSCPNCGAPMTWDPDADALHCNHCQHNLPVPRADDTITERPLDDLSTAQRGFGTDQRIVQCKGCGARVSLDAAATSGACVFCGSSSVLAQEANRNALRPESLIPLDVGRETVQKNFRAWTSGLWFRPDVLKRVDRVQAVGVYVPYWTFDAQVHSQWSADSGTYYWETQMVPVMVNGRLSMRAQQVRKVHWEPAWGERDDGYDDLLIHASGGVPRELAEKLGPYDTKALVPYRPEYLAGWRAEEYQLDLEEGWKRAQVKIVALQQSRCSADVPGDTQRDLRVRNTIRDVRWKHILLPLWTLNYTCNGKGYTVLIHGQTGRVQGEAPYSWVKILLFVLAIVVFGLLGLTVLAAL
jgi:predicted RNA-binding Zn-ribbon protein involved in translation (DUF1610 family)